MDKKTFISNLKNIADALDNKNMFVQAEKITNVLVKLAQEDDFPDLKSPEDFMKDNEDDKNYFNSRLKELDQPEVSPSVNTRTVDIDGDKVNVPYDLRNERTFGKKSFTLHYDKDTKRLFYKSADGKEILPLDAQGKARETKPKRYDFWKQIGGRGLFGDLKLPNLNKSVPVEPYIRKLVPQVAKVVRPFGDVAKQVITRPITNTIGEITDDAGITVPGRDTPSAAGAKKDLGQSEDRSTVSKDVPLFSSEVPGAKINIQDPDGKIDPVEPGKYDGKPAKDGADRADGADGADGADIKISRTQLKDIKTPDDLLFWSMMTGNSIPYSSYSKNNEKEYYSTKNKSKTLNYLNKLTSSNYVYKINPKIRQMKNQAETLLYSKTASKTMNRQILASMNEICNELELLGMVKAANDVTIMMKKYAQMEEESFADNPQVIAWKNFARSLAKKDPDFIPPIKPNVGMITYSDVTDGALSKYHLYKNNKKQTSKFSYEEENQLKTLAQNADRAR